MFVFGVNFPLVEVFFILVLIFIVCLVLVLHHLQRLQRMTTEERTELEELEKLAQSEKKDIEQIKTFENMESVDLGKFEKDIVELEKETDVLYLKKLAPDLYKVQNYVLWGLQKGIPADTIKANLMKKGWKDNELIEMVIDDVLKYKGYYTSRKGEVKIPLIKIDEVILKQL